MLRPSFLNPLPWRARCMKVVSEDAWIIEDRDGRIVMMLPSGPSARQTAGFAVTMANLAIDMRAIEAIDGSYRLLLESR